MIRVLIVEDSLTVRRRIADVLGADPEIRVIGEAEDGRTAIELCGRLRPDVVTLDMMLPVMSGLAAAEYIMAYCPTPIVIVSSSFNRGELFKTYEALAAGALEAIEKPLGSGAEGDWERRLISTVKVCAKIRVITHPRVKLEAIARSRERLSGAERVRLVAVGGSTGSPGALLEMLRALPRSYSLPLLVVVHLSEAFAGSFADWLDGMSPLRVAYARDGESLPPRGDGRVVLAPPGRHLVVERDRLRLTTDPERHSCRPSVDALFESLAGELGPQSAAVLLSGMGRDGAEGLLAVRKAGGLTVAQDESTSVVFGMAAEAARLGAVQQLLPLPEIAPLLASLEARR